MVALVTVLLAGPLGYLVRPRLAAFTTYAVVYLWAFVFQTLYLLLDSLDGARAPAFEPGRFPWSYGAVTAGVLLAGCGLLELGHRGRRRRDRGHTHADSEHRRPAVNAA